MVTTVAHPPTLGRWLKRLRAQHDLTQEALAELADCSVQTIRFFESGKRRPSVAMAEHLAEILHLSPDLIETFIRVARTNGAVDEAVVVAEPAAVMATTPEPPSSSPALSTAVQKVPLLQAPNALIGRESEVSVLTRLLTYEQHCLVTLTGMGGMGKTLLALHLAHTLQSHFANGAAFVPLASLTQVAEIPAAIAKAMETALPKEPTPQAQIDVLLTGYELLLVLDNFEHLLSTSEADEYGAQVGSDDALALLNHILNNHPGVRLLVTTRERLRLHREQTLELRGLTVSALDDPDCAATSEAVLLFLQRAAQVAPQVTLTAENQAAICQICALLEGQPLAIELAAAWSHVLSPAEIAAEITSSLDFLARGSRNSPARHRSLRSLFDHSWAFLTAEEQTILADLAIFRGGFTREGARAVAAASLPILAQLVDKSLIRVFMQPTATGEQSARYYIHNLLRIYLLEKLTESARLETTHRRHADFFCTMVDACSVEFYAGNAAVGLFQLGEELTNLRAVLQWAITDGHATQLGLGLAGTLGRYWHLSGQWREGREWISAALRCTDCDDECLARALVSLGMLEQALEAVEPALIALQQGLALWRKQNDRPQIAWTLFQLGVAASSLGTYAQAKAYLTESLDLYRTLGDRWATATVLNQLSAVESTQGNYAAAGQLLEESLPILRALPGRGGGVVVSLNLLGRIVLGQGEAQRAISLFEEALALSQHVLSQEGRAWSLLNLGLARLANGNLAAATDALHQTLQINRELERKGGVMAATEGLAAVAAAQGDILQARQLLQEAEQLRMESGQLLSTYEQLLHERTVATVAEATASM